jgi:peptide/nickel transport system substrate-binding protein
VNTYDRIALEKLRLRDMTRSARGTMQSPGRHVAAKAGLNRALLDAGFGLIAQLIAEKAERAARQIIYADAKYSSQTCAKCGHVAKESRSGLRFCCVACGHDAHADVNAARVILLRAQWEPLASRAALADGDDPRTALLIGAHNGGAVAWREAGRVMRNGSALALGLVFLLCACTQAVHVQAGGRINAWTTPHVLTMSEGAGDLTTLNPHLASAVDVYYLASMTMAWLIKWDRHNDPYPELATAVPTKANGGVSRDGLTITYHLRRGVRWSDGAPFDADDVVWTTRAVRNPANDETSRIGWDRIAKIDEPDKYTVVYHLSAPYSPFVETFFSSLDGSPCVLPKHLLARFPNINNVPYNALPVGIGPFKYVRWDRGSQVVLAANPLYWRGRPRLDKVILKLIPDHDAMLLALQAHELDMWYLASPSYLPAFKQLAGYATLIQPSYKWLRFDFNLQRPAVRSPAVRQALRLALDRNELVDKLGHGIGIVQDVTTPVSAPYYAAGLGVTPFDIGAANDVLDRAGWRRGADGVRSKGGVKLVLDFAVVSGLQDFDEQLELVRANWKKIGVDLNVERYALALMLAPAGAGGIVAGDRWDVTAFRWTNDALGDYSPVFGCQAFPPNGQNYLRWCNPRAQAAMDVLFVHYGQRQRNADVRVVQQEFVKDVPSIVASLREDTFVYNKDLKNWHPNAITPFDDMMNVDI